MADPGSDRGMTAPLQHPQLTDDAFLGGKLMVQQPKSGYRAGVDAVLLAAACPSKPGRNETVLDCGAGAGTVGLCVAARVPDTRVTLLEREGSLVAIAAENAARNGVSGRVSTVHGDVTQRSPDPAGAKLEAEFFDHVLANPPFHTTGSGTPAPDPLKSASHAMAADELDQWARFMARMAKPGGTATVIHKAESLVRVLAVLEARFGDLRILPIYPRPGEPAIRTIVQGTKGSRAPLTLLPGLVLHGDGTAFTAAASAILRNGAALSLRDSG